MIFSFFQCCQEFFFIIEEFFAPVDAESHSFYFTNLRIVLKKCIPMVLSIHKSFLVKLLFLHQIFLSKFVELSEELELAKCFDI